MTRQFLLDFSNTDLKDTDYIMRNFARDRCPVPADVDRERLDVIDNFTNWHVVSFEVGAAAVTLRFGGLCPFRARRGDACAVVPVRWDSIHLPDHSRQPSAGNDIVAAAYSREDARWWLCASDYDGRPTLSGTSSR